MNEVIKTQNLSIGYNGKPLMADINVSLNAGDIVALAGPNGAGKTTLFKTLTASIKPVSGEVSLMGRNLSDYSATERASMFSLVLTDKPDDMFLKVFDIVAAGRYPYMGLLARLKDKDREIVMQSLDTVGITELAERNFISLSDGEKQKVMIAKALAQDTPIIFMDEPAAFLDYPSKIELIHLMKRLSREQGKTILFSSHDLELLLRYSDQMWLVAPKKSLKVGSPKELVDNGIIDKYFPPISAKELFSPIL
ncbi:MAG: ABC transporter ATP-binding protein [Bacteroidales bacterium]|nr:ABC transporter ATP-binding protein [Bacteroidales bacterium]